MTNAETYTQLMTNLPHIEFEITLTIIQDVIVGMLLWPLIKRMVRRHDRVTHTESTILEEVEDETHA